MTEGSLNSHGREERDGSASSPEPSPLVELELLVYPGTVTGMRAESLWSVAGPSNGRLTDASDFDGKTRDQPGAKWRKTLTRRDFSVADGTGQDPR